MVDYFVLLNFPRTPWIAPEEVQKRFLELSAPVHPDRVHHLGADEVASANQKFSELNKAAASLRDHKERLHHLLALDTGAALPATQSVPTELFELSTKIGFKCKQWDALILSNRKAKQSPMVQAQLFEITLNASEEVREFVGKVTEIRRDAEMELQKVAASWPAEKPIERLATLAQVFAMVARWEAQLNERYAALAT